MKESKKKNILETMEKKGDGRIIERDKLINK
jgi:hypothetical protein